MRGHIHPCHAMYMQCDIDVYNSAAILALIVGDSKVNVPRFEQSDPQSPFWLLPLRRPLNETTPSILGGRMSVYN